MKKHIVLDHPIIFATVVLFLVYMSLFVTVRVLYFLFQWIPLEQEVYADLMAFITYLLTGKSAAVKNRTK